MIKFIYLYAYTKCAYFLRENIKCTYRSVGFGRANKELSTEETGTKCVDTVATQRTDWGCSGFSEWLEPPASSYCRHQGSSRLEAKQALQFSNLELTNRQHKSLKKAKTCHNEIQVSQMIFLMGKKKSPRLCIRRRKKANFGQSPLGHWEPASSARTTANQSSKCLPAAQPGLWELQNKGSLWGQSK